MAAMKIKIGTLHVEEGEFTERHTEYPGDSRRYRQVAQDVPLYVSFYLFRPPMPDWVIAEWPIYVYESKTTKRKEGKDLTLIKSEYWAKKKVNYANHVLDQYTKWTPDIDFPEPNLLISRSCNEWVKKYTPTLKLLYLFSARHDENFARSQKLLDEANAHLLKIDNDEVNKEDLYSEYIRLLSQVYPTPNPQDRIQLEIAANGAGPP